MKHLILLTAAVAVTTIASAQIQFGVKAGLNLAKFSGSDASGTSQGVTESSKFKVGFNGGVLVGIPIIESLSVQPEVLYSLQGDKHTENDGSGNGNSDFTNTFSYINIPILVKYKHETGLFAEVGPQVGFLLSAKAKENGISVDEKKYFKTIDFGLAFGLGYLSSYNIGIDARYNLGLANIEGSNSGSTGKIKNSVIQIGVFYLFGEKSK